MMKGGELYVPKIPSMRIVDLARAVAPQSTLVEVGLRPGEKLHEEMISIDDSRRTIEMPSRYVVNPVIAEWGYESPEGTPLANGFAYQSNSNTSWIEIDEIRKFISSN